MHADEIVDEVARRLHERGERMGRVRQELIRVLARAAEPMSVEHLSAALPGEPHRTTIYRSLEKLGELGIVQATETGLATVYRLASMDDRVVMVRCRACSELIKMPRDVLNDVKAYLKNEHGFQLHPCHTALSGLCRSCQQAS